ncbi:MAG: class I SAM-dependent methyltransferase [Pirellulaceae bacterium]|nr:class I SAM-dependent methyltransferase [Pirellulaceae bacterium]
MSICTPSEIATSFNPVLPKADVADSSATNVVVLENGKRVELTALSFDELTQLQCEQEPAFAKRIVATKRGSLERSESIRLAYESICTILDEMSSREVVGQTLSMGMDSRYTRFALEQLEAQRRKGIDGGVFELGFGSGIFLQAASLAGHRVGGLEVTSQLFEEAKAKLPKQDQPNLLLGDFCSIDLRGEQESYSIAYWNDVFEHIPVDEVSEYIQRLYRLLKPGGMLITITPNWHMRPSDVTTLFSASRTEPVGFHLKEYTLGEVRQLLFNAGFETVHTPWFISSRKFYYSSKLDVTGLKSLMEPLLEFLPFKVAVQMCRRFGLSCTIATKGN